MTIKAFYRLNSFLYFFNPWQKHLARTRDTMKTFSGNFCLSKQFYFGKVKLYYIFAKSIFFGLKYETNMFLITLVGTTLWRPCSWTLKYTGLQHKNVSWHNLDRTRIKCTVCFIHVGTVIIFLKFEQYNVTRQCHQMFAPNLLCAQNTNKQAKIFHVC